MQMKKTILALGLALAGLPSQAVTLNVSVPPGTRCCYVSGQFNNWNAAGAVEMQPAGTDRFTLDLPDGSSSAMAQGYKYLSGPDWKYVEKDASGGEIGNRTKVSDNDVVGSWAMLYNPDIAATSLTVNGYERKLRVSLPSDYATSGKSYPVVYMVGVQQRYSSAGSDDAGDDFFGPDSWNASATAERLQAAGEDGCIMVAMYGFVAENIPYAHPDFIGSGGSDAFLNDYIDKVVGYVNSTYRTVATPESTTILGADLGGLLSVYAALTHPDVFGQCVSMSPMLWLNRDEILGLVADSAPRGRFLLSYGSRETAVIKDDVAALAEALGVEPTCFEGGYHDDTSWGEAFPSVYQAIAGQDRAFPRSVTLPKASARLSAAPAKATDIASSSYVFYYKEGSESVTPDNSVQFKLIDNFVQTDGKEVQAQVLIKEIPKNVTNTKVYWNVARTNPDGSATFLSSDVKNVSFSTKKTNASWMRVTVRGEESLDNKAVSSAGFKVYAADATVAMTPHSNHTADATVTFMGADKTFTIHYGSVNSESDMGAITGTCAVSANCTEASVLYDFETNAVTVTETKWGETIGDIVIEEFSATPSVTSAGNTSRVVIRFADGTGCTPALRSSFNYGSSADVTLTPAGVNTWEANLSELKSGIYTLTVDARRGTTVKQSVAEICVKVLPAAATQAQQKVTVNAYDGIDWATVGRYKANFHTHTSQSFDCKYSTSYVVDAYAKAGYKILALTDHDANPYPWTMFDLFNPDAESRDPETLGMMAIPGVELSKDNSNSWSESTGGDFNHHNDFFTGRKGQEFASLRESYAYTNQLGGLQIINHPGQYWSLDTDYKAGAKNSPEWHAENFRMFPSLVGLEVYNQGNRRPNDRILWDQILDLTMPERPVWGYSCDDTHTSEQYFRNYQFMLMPEFTTDALKDAMRGGQEYFSYEYTGSGEAKAPRIISIEVENADNTITIDTDADDVYWISSTDKPSGAAPGKRKSTVVGMGKSFDFTGFQGSYVRALIKNEYGETCTQPFGFSAIPVSGIADGESVGARMVTMYPNPASDIVNITAGEDILSVEIFSMAGVRVAAIDGCGTSLQADASALPQGAYVVAVTTGTRSANLKLIVR